MLFTDRLLFLHPPKTAGMSTSGYLLRVLPRPVYLSHPFASDGLPEGIVQLPGNRHETLAEARAVVAELGFALERFPLVVATMRNPYDLEVSRWAFLRQGNPWERGPEQDLARAHDFEEFAVRNRQRGGSWATDAFAHLGFDRLPKPGDERPYPNEFADFFTLDGRIPPNLRIIRFERLVPDILAALAEVGVDGRREEFGWVNRSSRGPWPSYYTPRAEEAVYRRYRWVFDGGFYPRLRFDHDGAGLPAATAAEPAPAARPEPVLDRAV